MACDRPGQWPCLTMEATMTRARFNMIFGIVAGFFAVGSFLAGLCPVTFGQLSHKQLGLVLVGIWVFFPPIFF